MWADRTRDRRAGNRQTDFQRAMNSVRLTAEYAAMKNLRLGINQRRQIVPIVASVTVGLLLTPLSGCHDSSAIDLRRENLSLKEEIRKKDNELAAQFAQISELNKQLMQARAFKPEDLEKILYPEKHALSTLARGENYEG